MLLGRSHSFFATRGHTYKYLYDRYGVAIKNFLIQFFLRFSSDVILLIFSGDNLNFSRNTVQYLKKNLWLDRFTRAVFVEFTVYNGNRNLFSTTVLLAEFLPTAGLVATPYFLPFRFL